MKKFLIAIILACILTGCSSKQASEKTTQTTDTAEVEDTIEDIAINLVTDMSNSDFEKAFSQYNYTAEMLKVISAKFLKEQVWDALERSYGPFKEITGYSASKSKGYDIITVKTIFEKAKINLNIVFDANKLIAGINYTPNVESTANDMPEGITEFPVSFGKSGWELSGTLTVPEKDKKYPVVVLVHGSGPNDRDETVGPNKPFRDIAWGLAERGIATLRYDKRTYTHSTKLAGDLSGFTVYDETVEDAVLAVQLLKTMDNIDSSKIFVLGHSLGGMLIPRIAQEAPDAAGYIIMAGLVSPLEDIMVEQVKYLSELDGVLTDEEKKVIASYEKMRDNVKKLDKNTSFSSQELFNVPSAYWLDLKDYNPAELAREINKPLLILQGERDYQVPVKEFEMWKSALGAKKNVTFVLYDGLNHIMMKGEGKSNPQEYNVPGQVDRKVIEDIASWIQ